MITNTDTGTMDMEERDLDFFIRSYLKAAGGYLYFTRGKYPKSIRVPMMASIKVDGNEIPIEFLPSFSPEYESIKKDGANVPMTSDEVIQERSDEDRELEKSKKEIAESVEEEAADVREKATDTASSESKNKPNPTGQAAPAREPKGPPRPAPFEKGVGPDDMKERDSKFERELKRNLTPDPDIPESSEE